jgi:benzoate 4-monooxygenase
VIRVGPNALSFSDLADFEAIYGFNKAIEKGEFYDFGRDRRKRLESIFSAKTDASHREHRRKVFGPALSGAKIAGYEPIVSKHVDVLLSRLEAVVNNDTTANIANLVHRYTLDTLLEVLYGPTICPQPYTDAPTASGILGAFRTKTKMAWGVALLPWFGWLMSTGPVVDMMRKPKYDSKERLIDVAALAADSRKLIFAHPEQALQSQQSSIVRNWLEVPAEDTKKMTPGEVWTEAFNLTFAGPGSTAAALTSILFCLGTPEGQFWQEKIRLEAKGFDAVPASLAMSSVPPVLLAVIKETLRLRAPFPTAFPRTIMPGAEIAIPNLPAPLPVGTLVSAHTYVLGRSKKIWGEDAEEWVPWRWLDGGKEKREMEEKFVVFSKGPRGCVGRELAMLLLAKAVVGVLERWEWKSMGELRGNGFLEMQYEDCRIAFKNRENE